MRTDRLPSAFLVESQIQNPFTRRLVYPHLAGVPAVQAITLDKRPAKCPVERKVRTNGAAAGQGRGNGMPWAGACDCTEATVIDAHKRRHQDAGREISDLSDLALAWAMAQDKGAWVRLAQRLGRMAAVIDRTDLEFAGELRLLSNIARRRAFMV